MKILLFTLLLAIPVMVFGQSMNINWEDRAGRVFSINNITGEFIYSMVPGDKIKYITRSYNGPVGSVRSVGDVEIKYITRSYNGPMGYVKSVGGLKLKYITRSYNGPLGSIESTSGSVY